MSHHTLNYTQRIRQKGHRLTPQRQIILDTICAMGRHATAHEIYEQVHSAVPTINQATVYRALHFFCDLQLLVSAKIGGQTVYEIATPTPHHHLVCRQCGRVEALADYHFHDLIEHIVTEHHFAPENNHLTILGLCAACQSTTDQ